LLCIIVMVCGVESVEDIVFFGETHREWFKNYLALPNGIPSADTTIRKWSCPAASAIPPCPLFILSKPPRTTSPQFDRTARNLGSRPTAPGNSANSSGRGEKPWNLGSKTRSPRLFSPRRPAPAPVTFYLTDFFYMRIIPFANK
jgi:hypothetical protein